MIREIIRCRQCGKSYDENWIPTEHKKFSIRETTEGWCKGCEKLDEVFDIRRLKHESHT